MKAKLISILIACLATTVSLYAQNNFIKSRVHLSERQNKPAAAIPEILLKAYSKGDIKAYYPKDLEREVPYAQFLNHFGMEAKAYLAISSNYPYWYCCDQKPVIIDPDVAKCMSNVFEIGERSVRNNITYQQEIKLAYIKVIYSSECTASGIEKEGPIFHMRDIRRLKNSEYKIVNPENSSISYKVADYMDLRLFRAIR